MQRRSRDVSTVSDKTLNTQGLLKTLRHQMYKTSRPQDAQCWLITSKASRVVKWGKEEKCSRAKIKWTGRKMTLEKTDRCLTFPSEKLMQKKKRKTFSPSPFPSLWEPPVLVGRQRWRVYSWSGTAPWASEQKDRQITSLTLRLNALTINSDEMFDFSLVPTADISSQHEVELQTLFPGKWIHSKCNKM